MDKKAVVEKPRDVRFYPAKSISKVVATLPEKATSQRPFLIPKAQFRQSEFDYDIPGGCKVRIVLMNGNVYEGIQFINPKNDLSSKATIKLIKIYKVCPDTFQQQSPRINGTSEFHTSEISELYILDYVIPKIRKTAEILMETFVVQTRPQFDNLMKALTSSNISEVAFKMFGYNKGRFMELFWIVLCIRETLIPIDMKQEELNTTEVWMNLKDNLFENENIIKIVHDARFDADFLYHAVLNGINLKTVYDTQLAIYFMDIRSRYMETRHFRKKNPDSPLPAYPENILSRLSLALVRYLDNIVWERETLLLFKYESEDCSNSTIFKQRPVPEPPVMKYMALSVKYLSLLKRELVNDMLLTYDVCCQKLTHHMHKMSIIDAARMTEEPSVFPKELAKDIENYATAVALERDRHRKPGKGADAMN